MTRVWTYWQGQRPPYINACLESMARACATDDIEFCLLTPCNLQQFISPKALHASYRNLKTPSLVAACVRAAILAEQGGWWWDADTIAHKSPLELTESYPTSDVLYLTLATAPRRVVPQYIYFRPGVGIAAKWLGKINRKLAAGTIDLRELGQSLLTSLVDGQRKCTEVDRRLFLPIDPDQEVEAYFRPAKPKQFAAAETICHGLRHSWFAANKSGEIALTPRWWKSRNTLFHRLLHRARVAPWPDSVTAKCTPTIKTATSRPIYKRQPKIKAPHAAIVTLATGDYWQGAKVLFRSLRQHGLPKSIACIVLSSDPYEPDFASRVPISRRYDSIFTSAGQFSTTAGKFHALTLPFDRIILIDSDIYCLQDCSYLWSDALRALSFYAVHDTATYRYYAHKLRKQRLQVDQLFNAGVMVYNRWVMPSLHDNLLQDIQDHKIDTYDGGDQGYFNAFFQHHGIEVGYLPPGYNYLPDPNMPRIPQYAQRLFHFAGEGAKPWDANYHRDLGEHASHLRAYRKYLK